jgi:beta-barrel assembly-enhancing protease
MSRSHGWLATATVTLFVLLMAPHSSAGADAAGLFGWLFSDLNLVSVQQETAISQQLASEVESKQRIVRDQAIEEYVQDLGERLVSAVGRPQFRYQFRVVADRGVNAFGIGGGRIYVNAGLLAEADREGEVAAVLAHEIGHQLRRHVAKQISRQAVFDNLARVAVGSNASQWVNLATGLGITTGQLYLGREAEREADAVMVELMPRAGYDPHEAIAIFAKLRAIEGRDPGLVAELFSSHPPTREREEAIRQAVERERLPAGLIRDSARFQEIRLRLIQATPRP